MADAGPWRALAVGSALYCAGLGLSALGIILSLDDELFGIDTAPVVVGLPVLLAGVACLVALPFAVVRLSGHGRVVRGGLAGLLSGMICAGIAAVVLQGMQSADADVALGVGTAMLGGLFAVTLPAHGISGLALRYLGVAAAAALAAHSAGVGDEFLRGVLSLAILLAVLGAVEQALSIRGRG